MHAPDVRLQKLVTIHRERCKDGQTKINCPGKKLWAPESLSEQAFHPGGKFGKKSVLLDRIMSQNGKKFISTITCEAMEARV